MVAQNDIKRLLAYSSVEHMGLLVLGLGVGGVGTYGTVLHLVNNGLAKGLLFLAVGNVVLATGTSYAPRVKGILRSRSVTGGLLAAGLFAVTGSPPFGVFLSELTILTAAFSTGHPWIAGVTILFLVVIFVGIAAMILELVYGTPNVRVAGGVMVERGDERPWLVIAPAVLAGLVLMLGVFIPTPLAEALSRAAVALGGHAP
jgi:hydrogenase-4 component F